MSDLLNDPRPRPVDDKVALDQVEDTRPAVAATRARGGLWLPIGAAAAMGLIAFAWLATSRGHRTDDSALPTTNVVGARDSIGAASPPADLAFVEAQARGGGPVASPPIGGTPSLAPAPTVPAPGVPPPQPASGAVSATAALAQLRAPTLVVDFAESDAGASATAAAAATASGSPPGGQAGPGGRGGALAAANGLNADEQFASRVSAQQPEEAQAIQLHHRATLIPQGTTITGVLETALNSDLPGYARAVVSRDVRSFDGSQILIPRGSRVIGEYKSAVAQGQTRAFVIWTRVIRPDGVSIQIASSGTDPLGRAGLAGKVNTHFLERFSGAILLSVIDAGLSNLADRNNNTSIVIGSSGDAVTASLSALVPAAIPPTIKVAQGAPIRIFVARDLYFSTVQRSEP
jgi:type IV secretion system protein VirB10